MVYCEMHASGERVRGCLGCSDGRWQALCAATGKPKSPTEAVPFCSWPVLTNAAGKHGAAEPLSIAHGPASRIRASLGAFFASLFLLPRSLKSSLSLVYWVLSRSTGALASLALGVNINLGDDCKSISTRSACSVSVSHSLLRPSPITISLDQQPKKKLPRTVLVPLTLLLPPPSTTYPDHPRTFVFVSLLPAAHCPDGAIDSAI